MKDYSREAAHKRYENAAALAANAGSRTQAGLNEAYKQLNSNASWVPDDDWAESYQEGPEAFIPSWLIPNEESFTSYPTAQAEDVVQEPASMSIDWDELAKRGEDVKRENERMTTVTYPELQPLYEKAFQGRPTSTMDDEGFGGSEESWFNDWTPQPEEVYGDDWLSPSEHFSESVKEKYREKNPMPEGAMEGSGVFAKTSQDYLDQYNKLFESAGGIDNSTSSGLSDVMAWLSANYEGAPSVDELPEGGPIAAFDKLSKETIDDGTLREGNLRSKYMTGQQYMNYVAAGFGGRPIDEINPKLTYNKLDEMRDYNFVPYIADDNQLAAWIASKIPDDITKLFNLFGDTRNRFTSPTAEYEGKTINLDSAMDAAARLDNRDAAREQGYEVPDTIYRYRILNKETGDYDDVYTTSPNDFMYAYAGDIKDGNPSLADVPDDSVVVWFANSPGWWAYDSGEEAEQSIDAQTMLEFDQPDGQHISIGAQDFSDALKNGEIPVDYGFLNLGKDAGERKSFAQMYGSLLTGDVGGFLEDFAPNVADLVLQSAPIMLQQTGWPMSIANSFAALQGLDPRAYDSKHNAYYSLAPMEDMSADRYLLNTGLSALVPLTERIAGGIGGTGGIVGRPIKRFLSKHNAPKASLALLDALGEGAEEIVASTWEDLQTNGLNRWFANNVPKYDDYGNEMFDVSTGEPLYETDASNHIKRTPYSSFDEAVPIWTNNFLDQALENFLAGATLGLPISMMNGGRIDEKYNDLSGYTPRGGALFETDENGKIKSKITAEDFGTYDLRR